MCHTKGYRRLVRRWDVYQMPVKDMIPLRLFLGIAWNLDPSLSPPPYLTP